MCITAFPSLYECQLAVLALLGPTKVWQSSALEKNPLYPGQARDYDKMIAHIYMLILNHAWL